MALNHTTQFSPCRKYRYTLWREWEVGDFCFASDPESVAKLNSYLMVIGLNPSTADETKDDPTIRKCIGFSKRLGFGALCMTNLFAWRDTKPENMKRSACPIGEENDRWISESADGAGMILAAWGRDGLFLNRGRDVGDAIGAMGKPLMCLKKNKDGTPMHPLYVPYEIELIRL